MVSGLAEDVVRRVRMPIELIDRAIGDFNAIISELDETVKSLDSLLKYLDRRLTSTVDVEKYTCGYCDKLAREVSEKFNVSFEEARSVIYDLTEKDPEKRRSAREKLREWGALEYVNRRSKEILDEMSRMFEKLGVRKGSLRL